MTMTHMLVALAIAGFATAQINPRPLPSEDIWLNTDSRAHPNLRMVHGAPVCGTGAPAGRLTVHNHDKHFVNVDWCTKGIKPKCNKCGVISPASDFVLNFGEDAGWFDFATKSGSDPVKERELYPDVKTKKFPATYDLTFPKLAGSEIATGVAVKHYVHPTDSHCEDIVGDAGSAWWKANGWKYEKWSSGKCPAKYNWTNEVDHPAVGVTHRTMGVHTTTAVWEAAAEVGAVTSKYFIHATEPHCEDMTGDFTTAWYKANAWRFKAYSGAHAGKCPSKYNYVNKVDHPFAGFTHRIMGIKTAPAPVLAALFADQVLPFVDVTTPSKIVCGGDGKATLTVTNNLRPSIKFRTCTKLVDPKTGWACNHGTSFEDCPKRVSLNESAELDMDSKVVTILPITFTTTGAVDMVSSCYMQRPASGWPAAGVVVDQAWWDKLQKSC